MLFQIFNSNKLRFVCSQSIEEAELYPTTPSFFIFTSPQKIIIIVLRIFQFHDNYFRSIVDSHQNNTVSNTSAHNHSCSILCIGACVIFREKSLTRSNNSSPKWQSKFLHKFTSPHPISIQFSIFRFHQYFQFLPSLLPYPRLLIPSHIRSVQ